MLKNIHWPTQSTEPITKMTKLRSKFGKVINKIKLREIFRFQKFALAMKELLAAVKTKAIPLDNLCRYL